MERLTLGSELLGFNPKRIRSRKIDALRVAAAGILLTMRCDDQFTDVLTPTISCASRMLLCVSVKK
jgi:hypothetical protein